jgi:flagellar basal body-associated protein FliL
MMAENQRESKGTRQAGGKRLMVTIAAIAAVVVIAVFLLIIFLNGRPDSDVDGRNALGAAVVEVVPSDWDGSAVNQRISN